MSRAKGIPPELADAVDVALAQFESALTVTREEMLRLCSDDKKAQAAVFTILSMLAHSEIWRRARENEAAGRGDIAAWVARYIASFVRVLTDPGDEPPSVAVQ